MNIEKIKEALNDKAFAASLVNLDTAEAIQAALKEKGLDVSEQDSRAILDALTKVKSGEISKEQIEKLHQQAENSELSEEALEQVAGGLGIFGWVVVIVVGVVIGGLTGATASVAAATAQNKI